MEEMEEVQNVGNKLSVLKTTLRRSDFMKGGELLDQVSTP
jgi:hypothetical protein